MRLLVFLNNIFHLNMRKGFEDEGSMSAANIPLTSGMAVSGIQKLYYTISVLTNGFVSTEQIF